MTTLTHRIDPTRAGLAAGDLVTVRAEAPHEVDERNALLARAMAPDWRTRTSEKLRHGRLPSAGLAFVAKNRMGHILGTVRLWDIHAGIDREGDPIPALLLGPLAVDPAAKAAGIGSALMIRAIEKARRYDHGAILLVGDAPYYERFGFSIEKTATLMMPGPFARDRLLALELKHGWLDGAVGFIQASGRPA
ncbi:GNAT family N-acetyltransferase [Pararhizobium haloflavum]|uniref:GNAT family N-acetyltransferase n=1 Tax=Pararhizobium haloflavum TaxID=2037914 RepID=UPI000C1811F4|nr:N-acetyltransferase [Pararhizobium haloflavum]